MPCGTGTERALVGQLEKSEQRWRLALHLHVFILLYKMFTWERLSGGYIRALYFIELFFISLKLLHKVKI